MTPTTSLAGRGAGRQSNMLGSLAPAALLARSSAASRAPFLLNMARDLDAVGGWLIAMAGFRMLGVLWVAAGALLHSRMTETAPSDQRVMGVG